MNMNDYKPDRKIVAGAIVTLGFWTVNLVWQLVPPVGVEGAAVIIVAYLLPNRG